MEIKDGNVWEDVLPEDYLELANGRIVKNLVELADALGSMKDEDFKLHVYAEQNDFAEWIMEAYWDEVLAGKVLRIKDKGKLISFLKKTLDNPKYKRSGKIVRPKKKNVLRDIGEMHG